MAIVTPRHSTGRVSGPRRTVHHDGASSSLPQRSFPGRRLRLPRRWKRGLGIAAAIIVLGGTIFSIAFAAWISQDLPNPNKLSQRSVAQSTKIYARDGSTLLYEIHGEQRRTLIELNQIGKYSKSATLSIEDKDFYKHNGISLRGIFRALFVDILSGRKAQGGSTITQQLVKNSILTREKSIIRKVKEVVLSYQIERRFTKDQILKLYFNEIPYGSSAYGIEAAAQTYFNKRAQDLDLAESALLAAMVKAPTYYSPTGNHPDELVNRQHVVLNEMVKNNYITKAEAEAAKKVDILKRVSPYRDRILAPHFVFYVRDLLEEKYGTAEVERGGLRVVTTLDPDLQKIAEEEVAAGAQRDEKYGADNAALTAIDPKTGQLLAMVGSRDYFDTAHDGNFNVATTLRNPGSSFKPIVYLTAFMKGYTPDTMMFDLKTDFGPDGSGKNFSPSNYDGKEHGPLKMRQALAGSLNIPAVKTLYLAGIPQTVETAQKLGYTTLDSSKLGLALAIGGGAVRLVEHVSAFATLANDGVRNPTTPILRVEDSNHKVLELFQKKEARVVPEQPVRQLLSILTDNNARSFVFGSHSPLILPDRPVAAKTGTTNDFKDGWTMGFTPQLAAGVWVGRNDNGAMKKGSDGVVVAAPIWNAFMRRAMAGDPVLQFTKPAPVDAGKAVLNGKLETEHQIFVDSQTGHKIPDSCLSAWPKQYVATKIVREVHDILYYLSKDDPRGPAPTNPSTDPMFSRWEKSVQDWAKKNGYIAKDPPDESCSLRTGGASATVTITNPVNNSTVTTTSLPVTIDTSGFPSMTQVAYYVDDTLMTTISAPPFNTTLDLSGINDGFRTIRAAASNTAGQTASASVSINLVTTTGTTTYFISPQPHEIVKGDSFPRSVRVFAHDPAGVTNVALWLKNPDGSTIILDTTVQPSDDVVTLSWPTTSPGSYQLYITIKNAKGKTTQSDYLPVTVS